MRIIIGSPNPNFEPIVFDVKKNLYLVKEYYDKDDKHLPELLYDYACYVIDRRWPKAEPIIMKDPFSAYCYAGWAIGGCWPEAEQYIMKDPKSAYYYARDVIKGRWPEAEQYIKQDKHCWDEYCKLLEEYYKDKEDDYQHAHHHRLPRPKLRTNHKKDKYWWNQ